MSQGLIHDLPVCFHCSEMIEHDPVFAAPYCDHGDCGSAVFHGLCLMAFREWRDARLKELREIQARHERGECGCKDRENEQRDW